METSTSAQCSPGAIFDLTLTAASSVCMVTQDFTHKRFSWGQLFSELQHVTNVPVAVESKVASMCIVNMSLSVSVCTLPCGHVVSSVACGDKREERWCERMLDAWTCRDLSPRSPRCILHTPSEAFEACHLSATPGLLSSTNKTHWHTHAHKHTQTTQKAFTGNTPAPHNYKTTNIFQEHSCV